MYFFRLLFLRCTFIPYDVIWAHFELWLLWCTFSARYSYDVLLPHMLSFGHNLNCDSCDALFFRLLFLRCTFTTYDIIGHNLNCDSCDILFSACYSYVVLLPPVMSLGHNLNCGSCDVLFPPVTPSLLLLVTPSMSLGHTLNCDSCDVLLPHVHLWFLWCHSYLTYNTILLY